MEKNKTFEEKLARLEEIVRLVDSNSLGLEESMVIYEEGVQLIRELEETLKIANEKYEKIVNTQDLVDKVTK